MTETTAGEIVHNPDSRDHFEVLGLPGTLLLDQKQLSQHYYKLSRLYHPDFNKAETATERVEGLRRSAAVNDAFKTLKDPYLRGKWWLEFNGGRMDQNNQVPQDLIMLVFEVQDELREIAEAKDADRVSEVEARRDEVNAVMQARREQLEANFAEWDASDGAAPEQELIDDLQRILADMSYLNTLIRDINTTIENVSAE